MEILLRLTLILHLVRVALLLQPCPQECSCSNQDGRLEVICSSPSLKRLPSDLSPQVSKLHVTNSHLATLGLHFSLPSLEEMVVRNNSLLVDVEQEWLTSLVKLKLVELSYNQLATIRIPPLEHLHSLNLSHNLFMESPTLDLPALHSLDLSFNRLTELNNKHNVPKLSYLDLSHNNLAFLKPAWFKNVTQLTYLDLKHNWLKNISNGIFWSIPHLKHLDLSHNDLFAVGLLSFRNLQELNYLDLSHNNLSYLQENCFKSLELLEFLDLSYNPLIKIQSLFHSLASLKTLLLINMGELEHIAARSFKGLESLERMEITHSALSSIEQNAFISLDSLLHLDLSHNNLSTLPRYLFQPLKSLKTLILKGNPWVCDCYLYWLLLWLGRSLETHLLESENTKCLFPFKDHNLLDALDHSLVCVNVTIQDFSPVVHFRKGTTAFLPCHAEGSPKPLTSWVTPQGKLLEPLALNLSNEYENSRFILQDNGTLIIKDLQRGDNGFYHCLASNPLGDIKIRVRLTLDYDYLVHVKIMSIIVGLATSVSFLLLTLLTICISALLHRFGIESPCMLGGAGSPKARRILESLEAYKRQQLERLRENYTFQVQRIKENCLLQMERLRESYACQVEHIRSFRDYGNLQIDKLRDNYYGQVQRVRDYSTCQMDRLRENYVFQRTRIRKFSAHQLFKLRENCKLQQQHINKILESLNLENCKNVCSRTDSIMFDPELESPPPPLTPPLPSVDIESISQISAYFTPDESDSESTKDLPQPHLFMTGDSLTIELPTSGPSLDSSMIDPEKSETLV